MDNVLEIRDLSVSYTKLNKAVKDVNVDLQKNTVTAIMGPSGCGKSTLLRAINRMHELYPEILTEGEVRLNGQNIFEMNAMNVRRKIGMVFQRPNPFLNMSIFDNVLAGYKLNNIHLSKSEKEEIVEKSLQRVALWDEVKDRMRRRGTFLSGGQQQRLCIARTVALKPEVILMDEPTSALDPVSTNKIEDLIFELREQFSIVIVTHNMSQAARVSDYSMFMYLGELVEFGDTKQMFTTPKDPRTEQYLTGKFS
ncbi:phosphate ABC transporter ATP-binding protein PstB [Falsiporphyromonas endometrii]|uniref:Phosphate ABC transporter ATP-binding protein PstB n=1 Tax=Falsiporphyromonas endometrii TaxID=1387297 RepID=A0ABV9K6U9_9PORP